jgi:CheY-like chemotaxis protein
MNKMAKEQKTILVADDDEDIRESYSGFLALKGYHVVQAENGLVAAERLKENSIDLLITDQKMPGMDGYDLSRVAKEMYGTPVVMTSGTANEKKAKQNGVDILLVKPIQPSKDLIPAVEKILGK